MPRKCPNPDCGEFIANRFPDCPHCGLELD